MTSQKILRYKWRSNIKEITICVHDDENLPNPHVLLDDIGLHVGNNLGDTVEDDCLCNITYISTIIDKVGQVIQKVY